MLNVKNSGEHIQLYTIDHPVYKRAKMASLVGRTVHLAESYASQLKCLTVGRSVQKETFRFSWCEYISSPHTHLSIAIHIAAHIESFSPKPIQFFYAVPLRSLPLAFLYFLLWYVRMRTPSSHLQTQQVHL